MESCNIYTMLRLYLVVFQQQDTIAYIIILELASFLIYYYYYYQKRNTRLDQRDLIRVKIRWLLTTRAHGATHGEPQEFVGKTNTQNPAPQPQLPVCAFQKRENEKEKEEKTPSPVCDGDTEASAIHPLRSAPRPAAPSPPALA